MGLNEESRILERLKKTAELLYTGRGRRTAFFRYMLIGFDLFTIVFFTITAPLRVLRTLPLLHFYQVLRDLRRDNKFFRRNAEVIVSSVNLGVFIFLMTALVFVLQFGDKPNIGGFIDALYFTVTTLTTTGFGEIVLEGNLGRLLAVFITVAGVTLFVRLAKATVRPQKLRHFCPECGLKRHEPDAFHCRHCGHVLKIETEGAS